MNKIKSFFSGRSFAYYMTTSMMLIAFIGILVIVNLITDQINWSLDLTKDQRFTITKESREYIRNIEKEVAFLLFNTKVEELPDYLQRNIQQYVDLSTRITLEVKDPDENPGLLNQYGLRDQRGTFLVVEGEKRFRPINLNDVIAEYGAGSGILETMLTGAINYVTDPREIKVYFLTGHGEFSDQGDMDYVKNLIDYNGIEMDHLDLIRLDKVPDDAIGVAIIGPTNDITEDEKDKLLEFVKKGGHLMVMLSPDLGDPMVRVKVEQLPNLMDLLAFYNLGVNDDLVVEISERHRLFQDTSLIFTPDLLESDITEPIKRGGLRLSFTESRSLSTIEEENEAVRIEPLAVTSWTSWGKTKDALEITSLDFEEGDRRGSLNVAMRSTVSLEDAGEMESRLILVGNVEGLDSIYIQRTGSLGNIAFFVNSLKWLVDYKETINIAPKTLSVNLVTPSPTQQRIVLIVVFAIPVIIFGTGLLVWRGRKRL
jgi:ABC-2 type transport system permease protein